MTWALLLPLPLSPSALRDGGVGGGGGGIGSTNFFWNAGNITVVSEKSMGDPEKFAARQSSGTRTLVAGDKVGDRTSVVRKPLNNEFRI